ncbi:MAG TPA: dethiobiotin synthase [Terrimicrobiaceae bacterium]
MNYFITGTDTAVGKTYVTLLLTRALRRAGFDTVALKPVCCGSRGDVEALCAASDNELSADTCNPLWFQSPVAPLVAARMENRNLDLSALSEWFVHHRGRRRSLLIEGAGGWLVPLTPQATVADLARLFALPVLVVVANRLGCLNHTLLTIESIRARGLDCRGIVLNTLPGNADAAMQTNRRTLEEICDVPILFDISPDQREIDLAVA